MIEGSYFKHGIFATPKLNISFLPLLTLSFTKLRANSKLDCSEERRVGVEIRQINETSIRENNSFECLSALVAKA